MGDHGTMCMEGSKQNHNKQKSKQAIRTRNIY